MKRLVVLVGVMTFLIFAGLVALIYGLATKLHHKDKAAADIVLPAGSQIHHMSNGDDSLVLHVTEKGGQYLYFYDSVTGKPQRRIEIRKE